MLKSEFEKYVKSFNKNPGEFTLSETIEIGIAHKRVEPVSDRSWKRLAETLGWEGSAESLRGFVNYHSKRIDSVTQEEVEEPVTREIADIQNKMNELYMEKTKVRDLKNSVNRGLRDQARVDVMKETMIEAVNLLGDLPPVNSSYINPNPNTEIDAVLMLSDLHIGVLCDNFYNKYDTNIASKRLSKLATDVAQYCKMFNVYRLNVVNLGDLIHGIIHTSARIEAQTDAVTQVMIAGELLSQFLNLISQVAPVVTYRSCSDNHSRLNANKNEAIENENCGRLIDWFLAERLKNTPVKFCNDNIDYSLGKFQLLNGKKVMFAHGHHDSINRSFESFIGASREFIDIGLLGHYHSNKTKTFNGFRIFVNGSIVGTEQYALSKRLFSEPEQKLLIFDNPGDNIIDININLAIN